jgi:hypothetical protein
VRGAAVLFPVDLLSNNFTSVSYAVPAGVTNHYLAGLTPNGKYSVAVQTNAGQLGLTVTPGGGVTADNAGVLAFDNTGRPLNQATAQWLTATLAGTNLELTGVGGPLLPYQVEASASLTAPDWTLIGTATADTGGSLQFTDSAVTGSGHRFYRLSR